MRFFAKSVKELLFEGGKRKPRVCRRGFEQDMFRARQGFEQDNVSSKTMFRARGTFLRGPAFTFAASKAESFGEASEKNDSVRAARAAVFVTSASLLELKTSTLGRSTCKVSSRFALTSE